MQEKVENVYTLTQQATQSINISSHAYHEHMIYFHFWSALVAHIKVTACVMTSFAST